MKKRLRQAFVIAMILLMSVPVLTGCKPEPKPEEAQAYVQAVLDLMCTGDYDHSVKLADVEEGKESEVRDSLVDNMMTQISTESDLNDEVSAAFKDFMINALSKARYSVGEAAPAEDGGFDVTVSIEPLQIFAGVSEDLNSILEDRIAEESNNILSMSEEEQSNYVMGILIELLNKNLEDPKYDKAEEVTVHYGPVEGEDDAYGLSEAEGEKLGEKLFSNEGL